MAVIDTAWLEARIARKKELIIAYENAIEALAGGAQQYTLNTGQTTQSVTKANLGSLRVALNGFENDLATLEARLCGAGHQGQPGF